MPSRYQQYDTDDERLPEGMIRTGYDADTQTYSYRDTSDNSIWEGPPGARYGHLTKVTNGLPSVVITQDQAVSRGHDDHEPPPPAYEADTMANEQQQPFLGDFNDATPQTYILEHPVEAERSWRTEMRPLLNFFAIIGLVLFGVFWFLGYGSGNHRGHHGGNTAKCASGQQHVHTITTGETCWSIAEMHKLELDVLRDANDGINCDALLVGGRICIPGNLRR